MTTTTLDYSPQAIVQRLFPEYGDQPVYLNQAFKVAKRRRPDTGRLLPEVMFHFVEHHPNGNWKLAINLKEGKKIEVVRHGQTFEIYMPDTLNTQRIVKRVDVLQSFLRKSPDGHLRKVCAVLGDFSAANA